MDFLENYTQEKKTIDLAKANGTALMINIPWIILFALPYYLIWGEQFSFNFIKENLPNYGLWSIILYPITIVLFMIIPIVVHELIHGLFFGIYAKSGFKSISFGVLWKYLTPYCHCNEPLLLKHYIIGAIMPGIILGLIPSILALVLGSMPLLILGWYMTIGAAGDIMIIKLLWNEDKSISYVLDHPSEAGCYIYRKEYIH